jgi:hypothetical protein
METKSVTLGEVFSEEQLAYARACIQQHNGTVLKTLVEKLVEQVTEPALPHINQVTGQENDPTYWAWMLVYALQRGSNG